MLFSRFATAPKIKEYLFSRHPVTGEVVSINDAVERGFLKATEGGDFITTKAVKETKSFTITGAIDPKTGRKVRNQYRCSGI